MNLLQNLINLPCTYVRLTGLQIFFKFDPFRIAQLLFPSNYTVTQQVQSFRSGSLFRHCNMRSHKS